MAKNDEETHDETQPLLGGGKTGFFSKMKDLGVDLGDTLGSGYVKTISTYDMMFMKHVNRQFGDHLEVASRGACFVVLCALPFVTPHEVCPLCHDIVEAELYTAASITYFIYTLYVYTGDILHFAQGGIMGSFLAVLSIWMMQGFMPGGYTASMPHRWVVGSIWGICFVFLILWLNFDGNTRIFSLSTYVWYWMAFLKPDANAGFAQNFEIKFNGKAMRELMVAVAGCSIAVIAGYVPYPIYAHWKSMEVAGELMDQLYFAKKDFIAYYCGSAPDILKTKILAREAQTLRNDAGAIRALLESSWYEAIGRRTWQKQRVMLEKFSGFVEQTVDLLSNAFSICLSETFDGDHTALMQTIQADLTDVVETNGKVLQVCWGMLKAGGTDDEIQAYGEQYIASAKESLEKMTHKFREKRSELNMTDVGEGCAGENVVGLTFSKLTENTEIFFHSLSKEEEVKTSWRDGSGILGIFEPSYLCDPDHVMWAVRNGLSIIIAFYGGWHGYGNYIASYNAALASTVCVLLSNFVGSAMTKNLSRLQGVVIGIVLGNLLYAFLAWCYWWGHLLVGLALYFWTLLGLFMYYHSVNYATVGILLVVFGTSALLRPCSNEDTDPSGHTQIVDVTCAIVIMTVVDMLLSRERASEMAINAFTKAQTEIKAYMQKLFDSSLLTMPERKGELAGLINGAKALGNEAHMEPRYHRREWALGTFSQGIECLGTIRFGLNSIESAVLEKLNEDKQRPKNAVFMEALKVEEFAGENGVLPCLFGYYGEVMKALTEALGDFDRDGEAAHDVFKDRTNELDYYEAARKMQDAWGGKMDAYCAALTEGRHEGTVKARASFTGDIHTEPVTLKGDTLAEFSVFIESLRAMFTELDKVLNAIVQ